MSKKPRRWFRIHLLTAIVMMLVAGGFLLSGLYVEDVLGKNLGTDAERVSAVSLRPSGIIFFFRVAWIVIGVFILAAVYGSCERRIRSKTQDS